VQLADVSADDNKGVILGNRRKFMFCHNCGAKLADTSKFCIKCGTNLQEEIQVSETVEVKPIDKKKFIVPLSVVVGLCLVILIFVKIMNMPDRSFNTETLADDVVFVFKDEELKKDVEEYLGIDKEVYTYGDVKDVKKLILDDWQGYDDISALRYFKALEELEFCGSDNLNEISVLKELENLRSLRIMKGDAITDLSPLSNLKKIEYLQICSCNNLEDISPLGELTTLKELEISYGAMYHVWDDKTIHEVHEVSDISAVSKLTGLETLKLYNFKKLKDIEPLRTLKNLQVLEIKNSNLIDNIDAIGDLTNLRELIICSSNLSDITPLERLANLQKLELKENDAYDFFTIFELLPDIDIQNIILYR